MTVSPTATGVLLSQFTSLSQPSSDGPPLPLPQPFIAIQPNWTDRWSAAGGAGSCLRGRNVLTCTFSRLVMPDGRCGKIRRPGKSAGKGRRRWAVQSCSPRSPARGRASCPLHTGSSVCPSFREPSVSPRGAHHTHTHTHTTWVPDDNRYPRFTANQIAKLARPGGQLQGTGAATGGTARVCCIPCAV